MPFAETTSRNAGLVIDRQSHTIRLTRSFEAPRAEIFEAWTRPEHVACWWDSAGKPLAACEIDLAKARRIVQNRHPGPSGHALRRSLSGNRARQAGSSSRRSAQPGGSFSRKRMGGARMTVEIECRSADELDQYLKMGVDVGTAQTLDNLVAYAHGRSAVLP